jgi:outer membrane protein
MSFRIVQAIILCFFAIMSGFSLHAQNLLTIDEAIATALKNNHDIILAKDDSMAAAIDFSYRNIALLPSVNATAATTWNTLNQDLKFVKRAGGGDSTVSRDAVHTAVLNSSVNLNWVLFDGLRMFATRNKAEEFLKLGELSIKNQVITTVANVVTTYYDIVRQKQQLKAIEEQIDISQIRVDLTQRKLDIGVGAKPDVLQSKVDMNAQKARQLEQLSLIAQLKSALNRLMNVLPGNTFEVTDSIPINMNISVDEIRNNIENVNPSILMAKKNIDIAKLTLKERKAERFPTISFNSAYNFTRNDNSIAVNLNQPFFTRNRGFNYGFSASIPMISQARLDVHTQELLYDNQKFLTYHSINRAYRDYEQQKKALALEEENILLAKENVQIVLETYRLNAATLVQLREAQISLSEAYDRLIAARYNTKVSEIELLSLKGELVK